jgi:hypothetical protein
MNPWLYPNTWTHDPSAKFLGAEINTSVTSSVLRESAGWLACEAAFPDPYPPGTPWFLRVPNIPKLACQAGVTHWVYDNVYTKNSVDIDLEYDAKGNYYNLETVMNHFMNSGFQFILHNSFEKEYATVHTLAQIIKEYRTPLITY